MSHYDSVLRYACISCMNYVTLTFIEPAVIGAITGRSVGRLPSWTEVTEALATQRLVALHWTRQARQLSGLKLIVAGGASRAALVARSRHVEAGWTIPCKYQQLKVRHQ